MQNHAAEYGHLLAAPSGQSGDRPDTYLAGELYSRALSDIGIDTAMYRSGHASHLFADWRLGLLTDDRRVEALERRARRGNSAAKFALGLRAGDRAVAAALFRSAADAGHAGGQYFYGYCCEKGLGARRDLDRALLYYGRAGVQVFGPALLRSGKLLSRIGRPKEAALHLRAAAVLGSPKAAFLYAHLNVDPEDARRFLLLAADNGHTEAQLEVAEGSLGDVDEDQKRRYIEMAAQAGHGRAQSSGLSAKNSIRACAKLLRWSAEQGIVDKQVMFAQHLYKARGVSKDRKGAAMFYKLAADQGNAVAMHWYAEMLRMGDGVPRDTNLSTEYFYRAINAGSTEAAEALRQHLALENDTAVEDNIDTGSDEDLADEGLEGEGLQDLSDPSGMKKQHLFQKPIVKVGTALGIIILLAPLGRVVEFVAVMTGIAILLL
jgi:TPR repeat protein